MPDPRIPIIAGVLREEWLAEFVARPFKAIAARVVEALDREQGRNEGMTDQIEIRPVLMALEAEDCDIPWTGEGGLFERAARVIRTLSAVPHAAPVPAADQVEIVARAIHQGRIAEHEGVWETLSERMRECCRMDARSALSAAPRVTDAMVERALAAFYGHSAATQDTDSAEMMRAALSALSAAPRVTEVSDAMVERAAKVWVQAAGKFDDDLAPMCAALSAALAGQDGDVTKPRREIEAELLLRWVNALRLTHHLSPLQTLESDPYIYAIFCEIASRPTPPPATLGRDGKVVEGIRGEDLRAILLTLGVDAGAVERLMVEGFERGVIGLGRNLRIIPTPPPAEIVSGEFVEVRAAVAFDHYNEWTIIGDETSTDYDIKTELRGKGYNVVAIITARVPKPKVPVIASTVEPGGGG